MPLRIIGQQLIDRGTWLDFGQGLGCVGPEHAPGLEVWSGLGPHSTGGHMPPERVRENDCLACGAGWFLPLLRRMQSGERLPIAVVEAEHLRRFGKRMLQTASDIDLIERFREHCQAGGQPQSFFSACRIVIWDKDRGMDRESDDLKQSLESASKENSQLVN